MPEGVKIRKQTKKQKQKRDGGKEKIEFCYFLVECQCGPVMLSKTAAKTANGYLGSGIQNLGDNITAQTTSELLCSSLGLRDPNKLATVYSERDGDKNYAT